MFYIVCQLRCALISVSHSCHHIHLYRIFPLKKCWFSIAQGEAGEAGKELTEDAEAEPSIIQR